MTATFANIQPHDRVEVAFKSTPEARNAVRQLWAMQEEGRDGMLLLSVGAPRSELPDAGTWMSEDWEGNLIRGFVFTAGKAFDVDRFQRELGDHIETIKVTSCS